MNDIFKNEDEEDSFDNNKYIMKNNEEKGIKIETTTNENENENEILNHEINTEETNQIIPVLEYKSNIENENNINNENENLLSNNYDEAKMSIKNYLKDKISKQYNKTDQNEIDNNNSNEDNNNNDLKNQLPQIQLTNSSLSKGLNNMVINSTRSSVESLGNSIDNYIKMENLYLQDGKINSTGTNNDISNTNNTNNNITTNNNSNLTTNNKDAKNSKKKEKNPSKLIKNKDNLSKNLINVINYEDNDENEEKEKGENMGGGDEENNNFDTKEEENNVEEGNTDYNMDNKLNINYGALYSEAQQKLRNDKANEIKQKAINKLRPKIYDEIYKNEYNDIVRKIHQEFENQLKEEYDKKMADELNYIRKKEAFNQKIKMEEIDNALKEKVKNEFEEELNKDIIIKEKEIRIRYNQKLENFKKKFEKELSEEYEKKKKEMRNQLNDIKSKIYRSKCSEKIKINKINKMKKNIGTYNEKNEKGIKKIDKILGNDDPSEEENTQKNEEDNQIDNFFPPSLKLNNNNNFNQYEGNNYLTNFDYNNAENNFKYKNNYNRNDMNELNNYLENNEMNSFNSYNKNNYYTKIENRNNTNSNTFKRKSMGENSVNLAELNQKIKNSTDKLSSHSFISPNNNNFLKQNDYDNKVDFLNEENNPSRYNLNNTSDDISYKNEIKYKKYNDNKKENSFNFHQDNTKNKKDENIRQLTIINNNNNKMNRNTYNYKNDENNNYNFDYSNKLKIMKKNNNNFLFDKDKNIFYSLQIDNNIPTNVSDFGKYLISHIEKEENYKILFLREIKSFKSKIKNIFNNSRTSDHCLTDYLTDIWDKLDISYFIRYQIMNNIIKLDANNLYLFLDRETEYLTNYFQITEKIFEKIKKRENIKSKLQIKSNRNEIILPEQRDELEKITQILEEDIKEFKNQYKGMNIIWKGILYEWFMNYEKWFYEMELRNDLEYLN